LVFVLFFASGAAGLVYQVLWLRQLTLIFGATAYATSAILSTFMGGLALGSYWAGRRADRWTGPPLRTYGKLELGIAAYALAIPWLLDRAPVVLELAWKLGADRHFAALGIVKLITIAILILPATTLMGATLPVLSRIAAETSRGVGSGVGALYALNTLGAVIGAAAAAFVALPALGVRRTLLANLMLARSAGAVASAAGRRSADPDVGSQTADRAGPGPAGLADIDAIRHRGCAPPDLARSRLDARALVLAASVYAYASMLTAFLLRPLPAREARRIS
jgi:spermidine synthase